MKITPGKSAAARNHGALHALEGRWDEIQKQYRSKIGDLEKKIRKDDPIRFPVDLLSPIKCELDETIHTRALAYLLSPYKEHGFGKVVLEEILKKLGRGSGAAQALTILRQERTHVDVRREYYVESVGRFDIRIELRSGMKNAALIVLENKIDAPWGKDQRPRYEKKVSEWRRKHPGGRTLTIGLVRRKREKVGGEWRNLTYLELASALRNVWKRELSKPGVLWLKMYIGAITHRVLGIEFNQLQQTASIADLREYLGDKPA